MHKSAQNVLALAIISSVSEILVYELIFYSFVCLREVNTTKVRAACVWAVHKIQNPAVPLVSDLTAFYRPSLSYFVA